MDQTPQPSQANFGFVWLNRNFLWRQDGTSDGANYFLAISSNNDTFVWRFRQKMYRNESRPSLFIQNRTDGIKSTAYNQNW